MLAKHKSDSLAAAPLFPRLRERHDLIWRSPLPAPAKCLLLFLADAIDYDTGETFVSVKTMAQRTGLSRASVNRLLDRLCAAGWIERVRRPNRSSLTRLCRARFAPPAAAEPSAGPGASPRSLPQRAPDVARGDTGRLTRRGPVSPGETLSGTSSETFSGNRSSGADDGLLPLFQELKTNGYPELPQRQFEWMVGRIRARAKSPPQSLNFWRKSVRTFLENFESELQSYLTARAAQALREMPNYADAVETVKQEAAGWGLPYGRYVGDCFVAAEALNQRERALASALHAGTGPR